MFYYHHRSTYLAPGESPAPAPPTIPRRQWQFPLVDLSWSFILLRFGASLRIFTRRLTSVILVTTARKHYTMRPAFSHYFAEQVDD